LQQTGDAPRVIDDYDHREWSRNAFISKEIGMRPFSTRRVKHQWKIYKETHKDNA